MQRRLQAWDIGIKEKVTISELFPFVIFFHVGHCVVISSRIEENVRKEEELRREGRKY
jgi:hypothetical protein